ncbi:MAG TPA: hypothetical protein VK249_01265, partial [Anaerolineales bacterium]|nr:hypothetical protein [Anaerolineales bacterium]
TPVPTATLAPTDTLTATNTSLPTATDTNTPLPPTSTQTPTDDPSLATATLISTDAPTATFTATDIPLPTATGTATSTSLPPTSTYTPAPSATATATFTPVPLRTTGWQNPTRQAAIKKSGDSNGFELNAANLLTDNGLFATDVNSGTTTATTCTDAGKDRHKAYSYNLPVNAGGTIRGIEIRLDAKADALVGTPKMCVSLSWDNGVTWTDWKSTSTLTASEASYVLGSPSDTWGRVWTSSELTNANFQVRVVDVASDISRDFSLDWIAVNVTYNP